MRIDGRDFDAAGFSCAWAAKTTENKNKQAAVGLMIESLKCYSVDIDNAALETLAAIFFNMSGAGVKCAV